MTIKSHFLKQRELQQWCAAMVNHENFQAFMVYVRAELMELKLDGAELKGATHFEAVMRSLPIEDVATGEYPQPGLHHDLEPRKKADEPKKEPNK
jgi:hypothetical protein